MISAAAVSQIVVELMESDAANEYRDENDELWLFEHELTEITNGV